jgi:hypothetical protein
MLSAPSSSIQPADIFAVLKTHKSAMMGSMSMPKHVASVFAPLAQLIMIPTGVFANGAIRKAAHA